MAVTAGTQFTATLADPGGATSGVGARVEVPITRQVISSFQLATLKSGVWSVVLDAPPTPGDYLTVWMTSAPTNPQPYPIFVPLSVVSGPIATPIPDVDYPNVTPADVRPTVDDVAILERTRARSDTDGSYFVTFTSQTWPTDTDVNGVIDKAVEIVLGNLRADFNPSYYPQVRDMAALLAAILVEASFFRNQDIAAVTSTWRSLYQQSLTGLQSQIEVDREQSVVYAGMEPRQPDWDTDPWLRAMM